MFKPDQNPGSDDHQGIAGKARGEGGQGGRRRNVAQVGPSAGSGPETKAWFAIRFSGTE